jgi:transcriptional regulator with XRE-family HTH domain
MDKTTFRDIRDRLGLTQAQLAVVLDYHAAVRVSEIERGVMPVYPRIAMLMQAFDEGFRPEGWPASWPAKTKSGRGEAQGPAA